VERKRGSKGKKKKRRLISKSIGIVSDGRQTREKQNRLIEEGGREKEEKNLHRLVTPYLSYRRTSYRGGREREGEGGKEKKKKKKKAVSANEHWN